MNEDLGRLDINNLMYVWNDEDIEYYEWMNRGRIDLEELYEEIENWDISKYLIGKEEIIS